jgi:NADPH:quinone reductase-like Zn-dependent oxidoreductase/acyl carrier protein
LPTYPFENRNYWIDPPVFQPERRADQVPAEEDTPQEEKWLHVPAWREEPLRAPALSADEGWLIFEDGAGFGAKLRESLREAGVRVLSLLAGEQFEKSGTDVFRVRPGVADDLLAVLQEGAASGWTPRRILHLWQVIGEPGEKEEPLKAFDDCLGPGFDTLTALVNAIHAQGIDEEVQVTVAADGVAALEGEDRPACWEKASLLGPCRVAPLEMPSLSFQLIDVPAAALSAAWLAKGLLAEASAPEPGTLKALRESGRYIEIFRPLPEAFGGGGLRSGGVVLITGGMGGLGLEVAGRLFDMARMRLALLTRWQPPPVEDWPSRAEANDRIGQALRKVLALKARGAEVLVVRGDSAVADDMARVVEQVRAHFGAIHGVVHAAGASSPRLVLEAGRQRADEVLTPKVKGALILEELLGDDPLDFFISFSSIASVAPAAGQVDYSAANAVLDALARRWAPSSWARYCSISWDAWQEVGMAVDILRRKTVAELPDLSQGPVGEAVDHPLWQYCRRESGRVLFAGVLRPSEHWVVDEHRLNGVATTPGSGIMEMVHGAFRHLRRADVPVAIRGVAFLQLLQVPEEGLEVWLVCKDEGGETHFELRSCAPGSGGHRLEDLTLHTTGTIAPLEGSAPAIKIPTGELHPRGAYPDSIICSGPHWNRLLVNVTPGDDETVMRISLPQEYRPENLIYGLHPAVLDFALSHVPYTRLKHEGVPSAIGELRVYRRLPASVTAIVRDAPNGGGAVSVVIADGRGEVVAEADDFLQVRLGRDRVREEALERRLDIRDVGDLSTLELVPLDILPPQAGEVQIQVYAAGLNFRDVLTALGGLSDGGTEGAPMGGECSGRIVAVGPDVKAFSVGDSVMAVGRGAFATRINCDARLVARKPVKLSFEEAAGALIAYLTAEYALNHLGRLKGGERVLIHSAAGGVGLAAIQIATAAGAEIYATAGSEEKRAYLRDLGLKHVMDSRTLDFVEAIRNQTGGAGVDVVLNSLASEFIPAGLEVLRPYGRFLEIGKRDIYKNTPIGLLPFRNNLSLHAIDLSPMIRERHPLLVRMFGELVDALEQRRLKPGPVLAVPWQKTRQAMEHMAGARHIGKVVLVMRKPSERAHGGLTEEEAFKQTYERSIPLQRGLDIFQELLQGAELPPHVIVSSRSFESEADRHEAPALQSGGASERQRASLVVYKAPSNPTEEKIVEIWEQILSVESLGVDDAFLELGGDSIMAIQILSRVRKAFGVRLSQNALFEYPTVVSLSRAVLKQLEQINNDEVVRVLAEVEALSDEEAERNLADTQALDK